VAAYRTELRGRMLASPLCDPDRFSAHLARELLLLWESK
jgi:hypothetical protein